MNEPIAKVAPPAPGVPGVSTGSAPAGVVASVKPPVETPRLHSSNDASQTVPLFGGHRGGKKRADGLVNGSPEAIEADKRKNAERMRLARAKAAELRPVAPLPSREPGMVDAPATTIPVMDGLPGDAVLQWTAEDFRQVAVDCVELAEAWRVDAHVQHAKAGKLPRPVVEEIGRDAAFPRGTKNSLSNSSPATLAKAFNAMNVPIALKSVITTAPALVYVIIRDFQLQSKIERLIEADKEQKPKPAPVVQASA